MAHAAVKSIEYARAYKVLQKTPVHRRAKCVALLKEQAYLVDRLVEVRSMLDAISDTDPPPQPEKPAKVLQLCGRA